MKAKMYLAASLSALLVSAIAMPAQAQTHAGDDADAMGPADIVVTAQKRSESVQKIPLAVSAIGGASLLQRADTNLTSIGQLVPGFNVSEQVGQARLTLRGIGVDNISMGAESSVAFNQDGVFYSRSAAALASFYDIERVEVLRGPQGTLYGRNATGGSVNIITNRPVSEFHAGLNVTLGNYETINTDGFINGALSNTVSARLSFQTQHHSGYGENIVTGSDIDNKNSQAIRGQLLFEPDDKLSILVAADYYRSSDRSNSYHYFRPGGETLDGDPVVPTGLLLGGIANSDPRDVAMAHDPKTQSEFYGARADISYNLSDSVTLRSLSAYRYSKYRVIGDISPISFEIFPLRGREKSNQYTQEFQLNVDSDRNKLVSGVFYMHENIDAFLGGALNLIALGGPDLLMQGFYSGGRLKTDAAAIYAQDTYSVTDRFRVTVGGRYSWERKKVNDQSDFDLGRPFSPDNVPLVPHHIDKATFKSFTPKIGIDYDIAPRTMVYASYSRGFKSGTYNLGGASPPLQPEKVDAYEAGLKTTLADGRLRANIAGFYYNYRDLQVGKVQDNLLVLENAATARIYGLEGEFTAQPVRDLTLSVNASWLHARFRRYITADQARPGGDGVTTDPDSGVPAFDLSGNTLPQSPNYTINLAVEYAIRLPNGAVTLRGESSWSDRVYFSPFNRDIVSQPAYDLQNAFISYEREDSPLRIALFIKNIRNKTIMSAGQVNSTLVGSPVVGFVQPPRTFGMTLGYRF